MYGMPCPRAKLHRLNSRNLEVEAPNRQSRTGKSLDDLVLHVRVAEPTANERHLGVRVKSPHQPVRDVDLVRPNVVGDRTDEPVQVRVVDRVEFDKRPVLDARVRKLLDDVRAVPAGAEEDDVGGAEPRLAFCAEQAHLSVVTVGHSSFSRLSMRVTAS